MAQELVIIGELPDLNTYINAERGHKMAAAALKKKAEQLIVGHILRCGIRPLSSFPANLEYCWICKDRRKDKDNVMFAQKFVQDALVKARILPDDGWKNLGILEHHFGVDKDNPRVVVTIRESH